MRFLYYFILFLLVSCSSSKKLQDKNHNTVDTVMSKFSGATNEPDVIEPEEPEEPILMKMARPKEENNETSEIKEENIVNNKEENPISPITPTTNKTNSNTVVGKLVYKIPDTMVVKKTYNIRIRIVRDTTSKSIYTEITNTKEYVIRTTKLMEVKIVDPSPESDKSFEIVRSNKDVQMVDSVEYTEWIYDVTPLKRGNLKLNIVVSIISDGHSKEIVYFDTVYVKSNPKRSISDFIKDNWQWLISTIIIPLIVWFYNKRKNKKDN